MCKKVKHKTKLSAYKARKNMANVDPRSYALQPYKCYECKGGVWHLGHPKKLGTYTYFMKGGVW